MNFSLPCTLQLLPTILSYYTSAHLHTIPWGLIFILQIVFLYNVSAKVMVFCKSNLLNFLDWFSKFSNPPSYFISHFRVSKICLFLSVTLLSIYIKKKKVSSLIAWFLKADKVVLLFISAIAKQTCQNFQDKMCTRKRNWHVTGGPG